MSRSNPEPIVYRVRVRQVHHAWFTVEASSPEAARMAAAKMVSPDWSEYSHDLSSETWDVFDDYGELMCEGRAVT